ncbi:phosphotransferase, partial [Lysobacter maris]
ALLGRIAPLALAIEYVPGIPLSQAAADSPAPVFAQLRGAVARLHAAGITHNDLHPANVLIASGGTPVLIDFASSLRAPRWLRRSPLVRQLRRGDLANVLKMQARLTGIGPGRRQRATLAEPGWVRSIRDGWKRLYRRDRRRAQD